MTGKDTSSSDIWNIQEVRVISDYIYKINKFWLVWENLYANKYYVHA